MKTCKKLICLLVLLATCAVSLSAQDGMKIFVNERELKGVYAYEIDGHVMLPAEEIFKEFGVLDPKETDTFGVQVKELRRISFKLNDCKVNYNTNISISSLSATHSATLDVAPKMVDGKIFIPLGAILPQIFDHAATFDSDNNRVILALHRKYMEEAEDFEVKLGVKCDKIYDLADESGFLAYQSNNNLGFITPAASVIKFDKSGKAIWVTPLSLFLGYDNYTYGISPEAEFALFPDGKFIAALGAFIVKFDADGIIEWKCDLTDKAYRKVFITADGDLLTVENLPKQKDRYGRPIVDSYSDIMVTKIDENGQIVAEKVYKGNPSVRFLKAEYEAKMGLVIFGATSSTDGDFSKSKADEVSNFVASIDPENLNVTRVFGHTSNENTSYSDMVCGDFLLDDGCVYICFTHNKSGALDTGTLIMKISPEGKEVWRRMLDSNYYISPKMVMSGDGRIVVSYAYQRPLYFDKSIFIYWINPDGEFSAWTEFNTTKVGNPEDLTFLADGGFISVRHQPCEVTLGDYVHKDTESVVTRYNEDEEIVWQKVYNRHMFEYTVEMAIPWAKTGKIIVE